MWQVELKIPTSATLKGLLELKQIRKNFENTRFYNTIIAAIITSTNNGIIVTWEGKESEAEKIHFL